MSADFAAIVEAHVDRSVRRLDRLGGGDVAESYRIELEDGTPLFAKTHRTAPAGFFTTEALGLQWLGEAPEIRVPTVVAVSDDPPLLVLEWIAPGSATASTEAELGRALAALHRSGSPCFGREDARTTGSRQLPNAPTATWAEFYAESRLRPLARLAADAGALVPTTISALEDVANRLADLGGPAEPPARLHGDLWAGNRLVGAGGASWLIDPAAHGGHREFDLAMMRLFGGYGDDCFRAYDEAYPLAAGWERRIPLHQLAPLVVHAIKFGGAYRAATERALDAVAR